MCKRVGGHSIKASYAISRGWPPLELDVACVDRVSDPGRDMEWVSSGLVSDPSTVISTHTTTSKERGDVRHGELSLFLCNAVQRGDSLHATGPSESFQE